MIDTAATLEVLAEGEIEIVGRILGYGRVEVDAAGAVRQQVVPQKL